MLNVFHSNRLEALMDALATSLASPVGPWWQPEVVVVQSRGMERWVTLELARRLGISTQVEFPFPASMVWRLYRLLFPDLPDRSSFDRDILAWRVLGQFDAIEGQALAPLARYLAGADAFERFELAWRIAEVFEGYLLYRPDWITRWEAGEDDHWQAALWRRLTVEAPADDLPEAGGGKGFKAHRVALHQAFVQRLEASREPPADLPLRISLMGVPTLPPLYLDVFHRLGRWCQVDLYLLNPCCEYWGLILAEREIARCNSDEEAQSLYLETGNRLLASLGRQGRDFHHLVADIDAAPVDLFDPPTDDHLLGALQGDIFSLVNRGDNARLQDALTQNRPATALSPLDPSVQVHICHSALREVEVLHDQLLALFETNPRLRAGDVLVMTPDIDTYAPMVRAVFATEGRIPFALADRPLRTESPIAEGFLALIELATSRFDVNAVLALLEVIALRERFALEEEDLTVIGDWLRETNIRWGEDAASRAALELPATGEHTWTAGLQRLLLGFALPGQERQLYRGVLPFDAVEGGTARTVGHLARFIRQLFALHAELKVPRTPEAWRRYLQAMVNDFFSAAPHYQAERDALLEVIATLDDEAALAAFGQPVPRDVLRAWLRRKLTETRSLEGFLSGGVTFCAMMPMRSIPFAVVCMIGLNDGDFPRPRRTVDFDLVAQRPRRGDRSRRQDDRYLFLEALLSARQVLYLSYTGRDIRDNRSLPPSVLVSELLDYVRQGFYPAGDPDGNPLDLMVVEHPLQAFSRRYFDDSDPRLFSYARVLAAAADRAGRGVVSGRALVAPDDPLPGPGSAVKELGNQQQIRILHHPSRILLRDRLGVRLTHHRAPLAPREPFALEPFADLRIRTKLLEGQLEGQRPLELLPIARACGLLPHGQIGDVLFRREVGLVKRLAKALDQPMHDPGLKPEVGLELGGFRLSGWLFGVRDVGLWGHDVTRLGARQLLDLWVRHLLLNLLRPKGVERVSTHHALDATVVLEPVDDPDEHLGALLELYWQGLRRPLKFSPKTALAFIEAERTRQGRPRGADPLTKARTRWEGSDYGGAGEGADPYYKLAFPVADAFLDDEFVATAARVFEPLLAHRRQVN